MSSESPEQSPTSSPKTAHEAAEGTQQDLAQKDSRSRSRSASASYKVFRRDILYRSINEFQLSGRRVNSYSDLLSRMSFDLIPVVTEGETWYRCRGKTVNERPCRRMIPEVYLRTAIGKVLKTAETTELKGDFLIEELAEGLQYAICSEHHPSIHKIARAFECYQIIEEYRREQRPPTRGGTTPIREDSPAPPNNKTAQWSVEEQIRDAVARAPSVDRQPRPKTWRTGSAPNPGSDGQDPLSSYEEAEKVKVHRHYKEFLMRSASSTRASSRGRRRGSDDTDPAGSPTEMPTLERRWRALERPGD